MTILKKAYDIFSNKFYFKILYLFISFSFITILRELSLISLSNKLVIIWGMLLIGVTFLDILKKRRKIFFFEVPLYLFVLLTLFLILTKYNNMTNIKIWIINLMILSSFFSIDMHKDKSVLNKELNLISYFYMFMSFVTSGLSFILIILNKNFTYTSFFAGENQICDYVGVFTNENALGISAAFSCIISLYLYFTNKNNNNMKKFLLFNILLQFIVTIISGGRSGLLVILSIPFIFLLYKTKNIFAKIGIVLLPILSSGILLYFNTDKVHSVLTGRERIWAATLDVLQWNIPYGIGNADMVYKIQDHSTRYLNGLETGGIHNIYLQIAVVNGVFAAFLFILFIILSGIFMSKKISKLNNIDKNKFLVLLSIFLSGVLVNIFESSLLYIVSFISLIFWIYLGYTIALLKKD